MVLTLVCILSVVGYAAAYADASAFSVKNVNSSEPQAYTRKQIIELSGITIPDDFAGNYDYGTNVTLYFYNTYSILRTSPKDSTSNNICNIYYYFETDRQIKQQLSADGKEVETHELSYRATVPQTAISYGSYQGFSLILWNGCYGWVKNTGIYNGAVDRGREYVIDTVTDKKPAEGFVIDGSSVTPIETVPAGFNIRTAAAACGTEVPDDFIVMFETGTPIVLFYPNSFSYFRSAPDKDDDHIISKIYLNSDTSDSDHLRADCKQVLYFGRYNGYLLIKWSGTYGWIKDSGLSAWGDISGLVYNRNPQSSK